VPHAATDRRNTDEWGMEANGCRDRGLGKCMIFKGGDRRLGASRSVCGGSEGGFRPQWVRGRPSEGVVDPNHMNPLEFRFCPPSMAGRHPE